MKAFIIKEYGTSSDLKRSELSMPTPKEKEVVVKVKSSAVNDYDWSLLRGKPTIYRLIFGLFKPRLQLGMELSGIVDSVGSKVKRFKPNDAVYGDTSDFNFGTFSEYCCINEDALTSKPAEISFEQAAAISHAGNLASQALIDIGKIEKGQKVLINGAGGGVGCIALQLAKNFEAEVWGVDSTVKLEKMKTLGFDNVIDYKHQNFTALDDRFDIILDAKTSYAPWKYLKVLKQKGKYVSIGGKVSKLLQLAVFKGIISLITKKKLALVSLKTNKDLDFLSKLIIDGKLTPVIDGPFKQEELPLALQRFGEGLHFGKVIVEMDQSV